MKQEGQFRKSLNLFDATAIAMGSMIGSGIFIVSADIARNVGAPGWLLVVWIIAAVMTIMAAASYGELSGMMPRSGGVYVYLREAYSPLFGFLYGWTLFLVIQTGIIAAVGMAFAKFSGVIIPWISEANVLFEAGPVKIHTTLLVTIASILFLTWINTLGIREGKRVQNVFTYSKVLILLILIALGIYIAGQAGHSIFQSTGFWDAARFENGAFIPITGSALVLAIGISMVGALFSSDAWYNITFASEEVINPRKTIARSVILGTMVVGVLYILTNLVYVMGLPVRGLPYGASVIDRGIAFAGEDRVGTAFISGIFGRNAEMLMAVVVMISTFGCNNGIILSGARVYYAMARDNLFFSRTGRLNRKGVPAFGLWIQAGWSILLCLTGTYSQLLDYVIFAALLFFMMTIGAIFVLRIKWPDRERSFKAIGYPVIPALYILLCLTIVIILLIHKPLFTWPGLIIVLSGVPVYFIWKRVSGGSR
ncbi:MAG: amino acid permease [Bacteroidales bacterium]|nr:amino acid permease [Bacteroidales bacterium]